MVVHFEGRVVGKREVEEWAAEGWSGRSCGGLEAREGCKKIQGRCEQERERATNECAEVLEGSGEAGARLLPVVVTP